MKSNNIDFEKSILEYGAEIRSIEEFSEAVQKRPGMYMGEIGTKGLRTMIREINDNAKDEVNRKRSPADHISVKFDIRTLTYTCIDNGRGLPFDHLMSIVTKQHTSSNFERIPFEFISGLHGIGLKVVNAMSERLVIESYRLGKAVHVEFSNGKPWDKGTVPIDCKGRQGTLVSFTPNPKFMGKMEPKMEDIMSDLDNMIRFTPIGTSLDYEFTLMDGTKRKGVIANDDGVGHFLKRIVKNPLTKPIRIYDNTTGNEMVEMEFVYDTDSTIQDSVIAYANSCPTVTGSHINGAYEGIQRWFTKHMNNNYLVSFNSKRKTPIKCNPNDIKGNLKIAISAAHIEPIFDGQAKNNFAMPEFTKYMINVISAQMDEWAKTHSTDLGKICEFLKGMILIRMSADNQKEKLKVVSSGLSKFPYKYVDATGKTGLELYIVEGDSAAGLIRNSRDNKIQAYYPLKGKTRNPFGVKAASFLQNEEISGLITIIGAGYGKNFDISKCRFEKIVIMTDADVDGKHIRTLLVRFFIMYMPELIASGKLYVALPPLYGIKTKKNTTYLQDMNAYIKYTQNEFARRYTVAHANGKEFKKQELFEFLVKNNGYVEAMAKPASIARGSEDLIEAVLYLINKGLNTKRIEKELIKRFKYIKLEQNADMMIIYVSYNGMRHALFINDTFMKESEMAMNYIRNNDEFEFIVNGVKHTLISFMTAFESFKPNIGRYKGLGEMSGPALFESTMDPNNRTFIRITMGNASEYIDQMSEFDNHTKEALLNTVVSRADIS